MEISKRLFTTILVIAVIGTSLLSYQFYSYVLPVITDHQDPQVSANVHVRIQNAFGMQDIPIGNTITNYGETYTCLSFFNITSSDLDCIAIGNNSATIVTETALDSEGDRVDVGTAAGPNMTYWVNGGDSAFNVTGQFIEPAFACNATALHITIGGSDAYAIATFSQQTGTYNITITWTITYNGN